MNLNRRGFISLLGVGAAVVIAPKVPMPVADPVADDTAISAYIDLTHKQAAETFGRHMDAVSSGNSGLYGLLYYEVHSDVGSYMGISRASYPGASHE